MPFDINAFIGDQQQPQNPSMPAAPVPSMGAGATAPANPPPAGFDINRFINGGNATDPITGEEIPLAYSGNTPETAMNRSTLSATDKFKMSTGNIPGNVAYLKDKFPEVKVVEEPGMLFGTNPEITYRDGNTWYRVDPTTGDAPDAWKKTKEFVSQQLEMKNIVAKAPIAIGALAAGGVALATDGLSLPASAAIAGAVSATVRTSLGRAFGTYQATPSEQAADIAFESLLNVAGEKIAAGVKPTATNIAGRLGAISEAFKDTLEPVVTAAEKRFPISSVGKGLDVAGLPKTIWKKVMATASVGENSFDMAVEQPNSLASIMKNLDEVSKGKVPTYLDKAIGKQVDYIAQAAAKSRQTLSDIYGTQRNKLLAKIPNDFSVNLEDSVYASYNDALQKGIGVLKVGSKELAGADAVEYLAKNGTGKAAFRVLSPEEMQIKMAQGGSVGEGLGYIVANPEAHAAIEGFYTKLQKFTGGADRTGREGAKDLLDFKKVITDLADTASNSPALENSYDARKIISQAKSAMDNNLFQALKKSGAHNDFMNLNDTYDSLSKQLSPLLKAQKRAIESDNRVAYEGLLTQFLSRPRPGAAAREAIDNVIGAASEHGLDAQALELTNIKNNIQLYEAAKDFNPLRPGTIKAAKIAANSMALMAYATHHPYVGGIMALGQILSSPGAAQASISTVRAMSKTQEVLSQMTKKQAEAFLNSPRALMTTSTAILQAPVVAAQAKQAMQSMVQQAVGQ